MIFKDFIKSVAEEESYDLFIKSISSRLAQKILFNKVSSLEEFDLLTGEARNNLKFEKINSRKSRSLYRIINKDKTKPFKLKTVFSLAFAYLSILQPKNKISSIIEIQRRIRKFIDLSLDDIFFFKIDIKDFYESIDHKKLISKINSLDKDLCQIVNIFVNEFAVYKGKSKGLPTGIDLSSVLAEHYLYDLDSYIENHKKIVGFRYIDDIIILSENGKDCLVEAKKDIKLIFRKLKLEFNQDKSVLSSLGSANFDYLGYNHSIENCSISEKTINGIKEKLKALIKTKINYNEKIEILNNAIKGKIEEHFIKGHRYKYRGPFGITPFFRISNNFQQIEELEIWLGRLAKRFYMIEKTASKEIKLESLKKWFFSYKKNYSKTLNKILPNNSNNRLSQKSGVSKLFFDAPISLRNHEFEFGKINSNNLQHFENENIYKSYLEIINKSNLNSDYTISSMKKNRNDTMSEVLDPIDNNTGELFHDEIDGHLYEIDNYTGILYEVY